MKILEQMLWTYRILKDISKTSPKEVILIYSPPTIYSIAASPLSLPVQHKITFFLSLPI